jgi:hypothetical protein
LAAFVERARTDPAAVAKVLRESPLAQIAQPISASPNPVEANFS